MTVELDIQKPPKGESEDVNVILKIWKFTKSDHHFLVQTDSLQDYFLLQRSPAGHSFAPQRTFGNVRRHSWLSQLCGGGRWAAGILWAEVRDAVNHPTTGRTDSPH